jgi:hypothetical protein
LRYWKDKGVPRKGHKVGLAAACYLNDDARLLPALLAFANAIRAQTWEGWELLLVHDGRVERKDDRREIEQLLHFDSRIRFEEMSERKKAFGHPHRRWALEELVARGCDWVGLTNGDNWYAPPYFEWCLAEARAKDADFVHVDMVHSHKHWKFFPTEPRYKKLDLGALLVKADLARQVPFDKIHFAADGDWIDRLAAKARRIAKVPAALFTHN